MVSGVYSQIFPEEVSWEIMLVFSNISSWSFCLYCLSKASSLIFDSLALPIILTWQQRKIFLEEPQIGKGMGFKGRACH